MGSISAGRVPFFPYRLCVGQPGRPAYLSPLTAMLLESDGETLFLFKLWEGEIKSAVTFSSFWWDGRAERDVARHVIHG